MGAEMRFKFFSLRTGYSLYGSPFSQNKDFISDIYDYYENISLIVNVENISTSKAQSIDKVYEEVL